MLSLTTMKAVVVLDIPKLGSVHLRCRVCINTHSQTKGAPVHSLEAVDNWLTQCYESIHHQTHLDNPSFPRGNARYGAHRHLQLESKVDFSWYLRGRKTVSAFCGCESIGSFGYCFVSVNCSLISSSRYHTKGKGNTPRWEKAPTKMDSLNVLAVLVVWQKYSLFRVRNRFSGYVNLTSFGFTSITVNNLLAL